MRPLIWLARALGTTRRAEARQAELAPAVQAFLEARLRQLGAPPAVPPADDKSLEARILRSLLSKRFRKYGVTPPQRAGIAEAIRQNIARGAPIKLWYPFGGYKLWRFAEAPEADWAELFALMHCAQWLAPVARCYPPGIEFVFASDEIVIERFNNIAKAETEAYARSFEALIAFLRPFVPGNLAFSLAPIASLYEPGAFEAEFAAHLAAQEAQNGGRLPPLPDWVRPAIDLNVRLMPKQARDPQWREKVFALVRAYGAMAKRGACLAAPDRIIVSVSKIENRNCIPVGSTKASVAKFWVGVGALDRTAAGFRDLVLPPSQAKRAKFDWVPVRIDGLSGRNFERLRVLRAPRR